MRRKSIILIIFLTAMIGLAYAQILAMGLSNPAPDSVAYFEVAEQIRKVGYVAALSEHWAPLYPLYLAAGHVFFRIEGKNEIFFSIVSFAVLLVLGCGLSFFFLTSLRRTIPLGEGEDLGDGSAFLIYGLGFAIFCLFVLHQVKLRLPDTLVFCFAILNLWAWCKGMYQSLSLRWAFCAGFFGGVGYLARSNVLHWSLAVGILACTIAPMISLRRRIRCYFLFLLGILTVFGPQVYLFSSQKGYVTFGESGKIVFAETYGAVWKDGEFQWPVKMADGDIFLFPEEREVNFPGFYDPGRQYRDAIIPFRVSAAVRGLARSIQSTLFGYWSSEGALFWPLLWTFWPYAVFGFSSTWGRRQPIPERIQIRRQSIRQRIGWFLILAGSGGVAMHLMSFSLGYYLPPYLFPLVCGSSLLFLRRSRGMEYAPYAVRSLQIIGLGFVLLTLLYTCSLFRDGKIQSIRDEAARTKRLTEALQKLPAPKNQLRPIAVAGGWLGLYSVRQSNSQVYAHIPVPEVFRDSQRTQRILKVLDEHNIVAIIVPKGLFPDCSHLQWQDIEGSDWVILPLKNQEFLD